MHDENGSPIRGRLFVRSTHWTSIGRYTSSFVVNVHLSGPTGLNDTFESEYYSIVFNDPIHIDIRTHEDAFTSDYLDHETKDWGWERGKLAIKGIAGFEVFEQSQFLKRFSQQEPIHGPFEGETFVDTKNLPTDYRFAGEETVIHVLMRDEFFVTPEIRTNCLAVPID